MPATRMRTYRVYFRRPHQKPPIWDWSDTIIRATEEGAITDSYEKWVKHEHPKPVPPLNECTTKVVPEE